MEIVHTIVVGDEMMSSSHWQSQSNNLPEHSVAMFST